MSRTHQSRQGESRGKKAALARASEGNGQPAAPGAPFSAADPGAFDAAVDAFVSRAQREADGASPSGATLGKGAYHPAPANAPVRFLALGLIIGLAAGLLVALALR